MRISHFRPAPFIFLNEAKMVNGLPKLGGVEMRLSILLSFLTKDGNGVSLERITAVPFPSQNIQSSPLPVLSIKVYLEFLLLY